MTETAMTETAARRGRMRAYIQSIATGPEMSKPLSMDQAEDGFDLILSGSVDPVQAGIFLIALRMKRETSEENIGVFNALIKRCRVAVADVDTLVSVSDPFNGYVRGLPATPFLPAVLSACGVPAYFHGVAQAGPKYGVTPHQVLAAAGVPVDLPVDRASDWLGDPQIGWAYLDQGQYLPELHDLIGLRDLMVKRCLISTLEVVVRPISARRSTHLLTGYVHKAYPPVYEALARHAGFDSMALVKGVEGGCIPSLSQASRYFGYRKGESLFKSRLDPKELGIDRAQRMIPLDPCLETHLSRTGLNRIEEIAPLARHTLDLGLAALSGSAGPMFDSLLYGASIMLKHLDPGRSWPEVGEQVRSVLDSGAALRRFEAAQIRQ